MDVIRSIKSEAPYLVQAPLLLRKTRISAAGSADIDPRYGHASFS